MPGKCRFVGILPGVRPMSPPRHVQMKSVAPHFAVIGSKAETGRKNASYGNMKCATNVGPRTWNRDLESCMHEESSHAEAEPYHWRQRVSLRPLTRILGALVLLLPVGASASDSAMTLPASAEGLALARYVVSTQTASPFHTKETVVVAVEASLPGLFKESQLIALRRLGDSGRNEYRLLQTTGDVTVTQEVIAPYLAMLDGIEELPASSVAVTPANYRFRYLGQVGTGAATAYVFRITPRRKRDGLIEGQLWIDALTGTGVLETGRLVRTPSDFAPGIQVVRDTKLLHGVPCVRISHVFVETHRAGRGQLTITEYRLSAAGDAAPPPFDGPGTSVGSLTVESPEIVLVDPSGLPVVSPRSFLPR